MTQHIQRIHVEHDKVSPRAARAFVKAVEVMRSRVPVRDLADAIGSKNLHAAMAIATRIAIEEALVPLAAIAQDAGITGGKLGLPEV